MERGFFSSINIRIPRPLVAVWSHPRTACGEVAALASLAFPASFVLSLFLRVARPWWLSPFFIACISQKHFSTSALLCALFHICCCFLFWIQIFFAAVVVKCAKQGCLVVK